MSDIDPTRIIALSRKSVRSIIPIPEPSSTRKLISISLELRRWEEMKLESKLKLKTWRVSNNKSSFLL